MTTPIPAALKAADVSRFALRAAQLDKPKPILAYWCNYWIVNQILSKGLHNADQESMQYTMNLMDKLEQAKADHAQEPAVTDDIAGKAYVEQFGLETFARADNAVRANKASRQTADTFQAAATFLDLLQIWGEIDHEITQKIKYAKFHALRIAKAIKAGEDPNLSNPAVEPAAEPAAEPAPESEIAPDPRDPDVQMLNGVTTTPRQPSVVEVRDEADRQQNVLAKTSSLDQSLHPSRDASPGPSVVDRERESSVREVPDEADKLSSNPARQSSINEPLHPSRAPSTPPPPAEDVSPLAPGDADTFYKSGADPSKPDISPLNSPTEAERKSSIGGAYFPSIPVSQSTQPPSIPPTDPSTTIEMPSAPSEKILPSAPSSFSSTQPRSNAPPPPPPPPPPTHHGHFLPHDPTQPSSANIPPNFQPNPSFPPQQPVLPTNQQHHQPQHRGSHGPVPPVPPGASPRSSIGPGAQSQPQFTQQFSLPPPHVNTQSPQAQPPQPTVPPYQPPPQPQRQLQPQAQPQSPSTTLPVSNAVVDEESIMKAQKHARWAISALNFEDVPTAIRELRAALGDLGAG